MTQAAKRMKCEIRESHFIDPCWPLSEVSQYSNSGKGVRHLPYIDLTTGKPSCDVYSLVSGAHAKRGIAMTFCPFCGSSLKTWGERNPGAADRSQPAQA